MQSDSTTPSDARRSRWHRSAAFSAALVSLSLGLASGCSTSPRSDETKEPPAAPGPKIERFGAELSPAAERVELERALSEPEAFAGKTVLVEGEVRRACSKKGCWMELATSASPEAPGCRVTFLNYGFFVPTNSAGSRARVEGVLEMSEVKPSHVAHLEAEGASFAAKRGDGGAREVRLVARGVELERKGGS